MINVLSSGGATATVPRSGVDQHSASWDPWTVDPRRPRRPVQLLQVKSSQVNQSPFALQSVLFVSIVCTPPLSPNSCIDIAPSPSGLRVVPGSYNLRVNQNRPLQKNQSISVVSNYTRRLSYTIEGTDTLLLLLLLQKKTLARWPTRQR
jgi:hypothetical protein